ncbi:hypothetical protein COLO4_35378 [Corchorus olitorius]|uniref:Uncharacterized protein n=1 Tax=Corchorus olitorius TaxID=93759 RepID=A0A1R3GH90_9ROSI|nr:hypothetical protein COLO4_35378 [Corchorus olitorius]
MAGDYIAATAAAKQHIEEIRSKKFAIGSKEPNPLTEDLHHAVTSLSAELYTKDVHFLMELIQKNMESICSVGKSTKKGKKNLGFIGEKGIGFKSVFLVSMHPHIFSNGYQVKFSEAPNQDCGIGYIVPEWVEEASIVSDVCDIYGVDKIFLTTTIILPLKPEKVESVKRQLSQLHPELLLFLCKIKRLSVRGCSNDPNEAETVSAIFVSSETHQNAMPSDRANSCVVHLSAKEKLESTAETCQYFIWRQAFQVKPESKVSTRNDVDDWIVSLAFPFGKRLKRGASSIGIFAFLPTAMVTNFPFVIHADFVLASSREAILLDSKWNMGILGCVPAAFFNAFSFCLRSPVCSMTQAFEFLPARASSIPELNNIRESIKIMLLKERTIPCEMFCGEKRWCKPGSAIKIQKKFRELLCDVQKQDISLKGWNSCTVYDYAVKVFHALNSKNEPEIAIDCAHFIYHSHSNGFIAESELHHLCRIMPIVDGSGRVRKQRSVTLVPTSRSKWATLLGPTNPFLEQNYVDLAEAYGKSHQCIGEHTPEEELLDFLAQNLRAKDLPQLWPPDMVLPLRSCLTCEEAYLLLDWIRFLRIRVSSIPQKFIQSIRDQRWMKAYSGFSCPSVLERTDVPSLDEDHYNSDFSVFKNELRVIDVKVDPGEALPDNSNSLVWIPSQNGAGGGEWISSHLCVLCDKYQLFGSRLYALEDYYPEELLPMFTSIFGVAKFPSTDDYMQLWNDWILRSTGQVTAVECFSFFGFVLDNLNQCTLEALKKNLTKLPATIGRSEEIYLVSKEEVFVPDDLQLKRIFENVEVPLFTWFSRQRSPWRLDEVYNAIGVRKISESVVQKVDHPVLSNYESEMFADSRNGLFTVGLFKIILAFLAGPMMNMPAKKRCKAAKSLLKLSVFETDKAIHVNYQLVLSRRGRTLEVRRTKMVFWDRRSHRLILDRSGFGDRKTNIEFVSSFAQEISEGVLSKGPTDAINDLSKLLQIGLMFDFKEDAVEFLLMKENLELFVADTEFLNAEFGKQTHPRSEQLGPLTPIPSSKKRRQ